MAASLPFIHIRASKFPVLPGEEQELVNPGTYGKALAQYLQASLKERAYDVAFICCEDWGWWVEIKNLPLATGVCVYATSDLPQSNELCIAIRPAPGRYWSWRRFRAIDATPYVTKLFADISEIVRSDPDVQVLGFPEDFPLADPHPE